MFGRQPAPTIPTPIARLSHYRDMARLAPFPTSVPAPKFAEYAFAKKVVPVDYGLENNVTRNAVSAGLHALGWDWQKYL